MKGHMKKKKVETLLVKAFDILSKGKDCAEIFAVKKLVIDAIVETGKLEPCHFEK